MSAELLQLNNENGKCLTCGGELDTGWECTECGADNMDWYYPPHERGPTKEITDLCKAGNLVPVNAACQHCGAEPGDKCGGI